MQPWVVELFDVIPIFPYFTLTLFSVATVKVYRGYPATKIYKIEDELADYTPPSHFSIGVLFISDLTLVAGLKANKT